MLMIEEGRQRTLDELDDIEVPTVAPWALARGGGTRWKPINHGILARAVVATAEDGGLVVERADWATSSNDQDLFGAIVFGRTGAARRRGGRLPKGMSLAMALRHSNAGRYAVTFGFGARVAVCTNGMFVGEHVVSRKHTKDLRVESLVNEGFAHFHERVAEIGEQTRRLGAKRLDDASADRLLVEAGRRRVLPWSQLGKVEKEWREPSFPAFRRRTAWSLYNAFTHVAKTRSPARQLSALRALRDLFAPEVIGRIEG